MEDIRSSMKERYRTCLRRSRSPWFTNGKKPFVILALGVNGVGKTTTIAKLASIYLGERKHVLLGACDTFGRPP